MTNTAIMPRALRNFAEQQDGALTAFGLFLGLSSIVVGGLAIDVANAMMARTKLQAAADAGAHAALYIREWEDSAIAKQAALDLVNVNMPSAHFGSLLTADDIKFGYWDPDTQQFQIDADSKDGVFVDISRIEAKNNSVCTYFLKFAGFGSWDVRRGAVFETYIPTCFREGFVADGIVDVQSNNIYTSGFCIHSNSHVELNQNNFFAANTVVSMPNKTDIVLPASGFESNVGLEDSLRDGSYQIRILNRLPDIIDDLYAGGASYAPDYITSPIVITLASRKISPGDLTPGRIHTIACTGGGQTASFSGGVTYSQFVLVTSCRVSFGQGVVLENVVVTTTHTGVKSMNAPASLQVGRNDHCATDGGTQLLTMGGMEYPADLMVYGSQLIAQNNISFTANANGIEGASFIAGGTISGTSNMTMGFCDSAGMERMNNVLRTHI
ncbi:hypothetical protein HGD85_00900 [Rhodobacteraceae bacterium R_SAG10]|nr:hypothetical protein [Rhodobacteraceae bacterium R_SAG10]